MPVLFAGSASAAEQVFTSGSSGSVPQSINVNPDAPDLMAITALLWAGTVTATGGTFGVSFAGHAMTPLGSPIYWGSNQFRLQAYALADPPTGSGLTVTSSFSGLSVAGQTGVLMPVTVLYSGVASVGTPVTAGGSASTNNSVTVPSVSPAHRVVAINAAAGLGSPPTNLNMLADWDGYSLALRARGTAPPATVWMAVSDGPGAASVIGAATNNFNNALWGAIGFDLAPAPVQGSAAIQLAALIGMQGNARIQRTTSPSPLRTWVIGADQ